MHDYVGRTGAHALVYRSHSSELTDALELARQVIVRVGPSAGLFVAFCLAWAVVFGVALQ